MSALNPDCEQGKHAACSGTAWHFDADDLTACACACHVVAEQRRMVSLWSERYPWAARYRGVPT